MPAGKYEILKPYSAVQDCSSSAYVYVHCGTNNEDDSIPVYSLIYIFFKKHFMSSSHFTVSVGARWTGESFELQTDCTCSCLNADNTHSLPGANMYLYIYGTEKELQPIC